jgi:hypothetical protein
VLGVAVLHYSLSNKLESSNNCDDGSKSISLLGRSAFSTGAVFVSALFFFFWNSSASFIII